MNYSYISDEVEIGCTRISKYDVDAFKDAIVVTQKDWRTAI